MLNIADLIAILLILIAIFRGYKKGFIKTGFGVLSFFIAVAITFIFYKPVMNFIKEKTGFENWISEYLYSIDINDEEKISGEQIVTDDYEENYLENLPENIIDTLGLEKIKSNAKTALIEKIVNFTVKLLAILLVYITTKILLVIIVYILDSIAKLPILKQFNEILGLVLGAFLGIIQIYSICAVITLICAFPAMNKVLLVINNSLFVHIFYDNNLLLKILF